MKSGIIIFCVFLSIFLFCVFIFSCLTADFTEIGYARESTETTEGDKVKDSVTVDNTKKTEEGMGERGFTEELEDEMEFLETEEIDIGSERPRTGPAGLKAGFVDDNKQFNLFVNFLEQYSSMVRSYPMAVQERIILNITDGQGNSLPNAWVDISMDNYKLEGGRTYADGTYLFFPAQYNNTAAEYKAEITYGQNKRQIDIPREGTRQLSVKYDLNRNLYKNVPLDILFIFDTTGSMGEEIDRLKKTIENIYLNISYLSSQPKVRFGMVLYKDIYDEYLTRIIPLTADLEDFQRELDKVYAEGGGDTEEDLQSALKDAMTQIKWNTDGIRLGFIITDAPPHLDYEQEYTYVDSCYDAKNKGIKLFTLGTGGLPLNGELILRQISQYTYAKYIFLTYGEEGESEGGAPRSVSHHTGANYQVENLESIIIRIAKEELSYLTDQPLDEGEEYFQAVYLQTEKKEDTLKTLFDMAIAQLIDYSTIKIDMGTKASLLPFTTKEQKLDTTAEYFTEQALLSLALNKTFKLVERKDLPQLLAEMELQLSDIVDEKASVEIGKVLGAEMMIVGNLYIKDEQYELFLKLLRVETAEIIAVTKLKIDKKLGLGV